MSDSIQTIPGSAPVPPTPCRSPRPAGPVQDRCWERCIPPCRVAVVTDSAVAPLYLERVTASLTSAGFAVVSYVFPAGESHKNMATLSGILEFLAREHLTRHGTA